MQVSVLIFRIIKKYYIDYFQFQVRVYDNRVTNRKSDIATVTITVVPLLGPPKFFSDEYSVTIPITTPIGSGIFNQIGARDDDLQVLCDPLHDKSHKMTCARSEDSDQPWHPHRETLIRLSGCGGWSEFSLGAHASLFVLSCAGSLYSLHFILSLYNWWTKWHLPCLIRGFSVRMNKHWVLSYPVSALRRPWSDWADAQADLSFCGAHIKFVGFVMRRLKCFTLCVCG